MVLECRIKLKVSTDAQWRDVLARISPQYNGILVEFFPLDQQNLINAGRTLPARSMMFNTNRPSYGQDPTKTITRGKDPTKTFTYNKATRSNSGDFPADQQHPKILMTDIQSMPLSPNHTMNCALCRRMTKS
jgi:hypothetical protein